MEFEVWFSRSAVDEAGRMISKWWDWPLLLLKNIYALLWGLGMTCLGLTIFFRTIVTPKPDLGRLALGLLLGLGIPGFAWWRYRREVKKEAEAMLALSPQRMAFETDGLRTRAKSGEANVVPWSLFDGFREGKHVFLLHGPNKLYRVIPKNTQPPEDVERLRSAVRSRLPERK